MDFFISYRYEDRHLAGKVAEGLKKSNQACFLAHENIRPSKFFEDEIKNRLRNCSALVAIVTSDFEGSSYPSQEVGFAMGIGKPIIPLWFPGVESDELGFLKAVHAIHTTEDNLNEAILKIIRTTEEEMANRFVRAPDASIEGLIGGFLEPRGEPYYQVLVRPQGLFEMIQPNNENLNWLIANRPEPFARMDFKPTQRGVAYSAHPMSYRAEIFNTGEICFGQSVPPEDGIVLEAFVLRLAQVMEYARRIYSKYGWNDQQNGLARIELKIGRSHGQILKTGNPSGWIGQFPTDLEAVTGEEAVRVETLSDPNPTIEKILMKICRGFGRPMSEKSAKGWVALSLGQPRPVSA